MASATSAMGGADGRADVVGHLGIAVAGQRRLEARLQDEPVVAQRRQGVAQSPFLVRRQMDCVAEGRRVEAIDEGQVRGPRGRGVAGGVDGGVPVQPSAGSFRRWSTGMKCRRRWNPSRPRQSTQPARMMPPPVDPLFWRWGHHRQLKPEPTLCGPPGRGLNSRELTPMEFLSRLSAVVGRPRTA